MLAAFVRLLLLAGPLLARAAGPGSPATEAAWQALKSGQAALHTDTAQAGRRIRQALARSQALGFTEGVGGAYLLLGQLQADRGHYPAALRLYHRAEQLFTARYRTHPTPRLQSNLGIVANCIGVAEREQGHAQQSIVAYLRAADYITATRNYDALLVLYYNLANCFGELDQRPQQLAYLQRSIALRAQPLQHPEQLLSPYAGLALLLLEQRQPQEAWRYLEQARHILALPQAKYHQAAYERARGIYFFETKQYQRAQASFRAALAAVQQQGNAKHVADMLLALGRTARQLGNYRAASAYLHQGLRLARAQQNLPLQATLLDLLAEQEEAQGARHAPAVLAYFKQLKAVESRLESEQTKRTILQLETRYRTRHQQQEIRLLRARQAAQQQELQRRTTLNYTALALLGALGLGYAALHARQKLAVQQQAMQTRKIEELEQERQRLALEAMLRGQDEERRRLARDLHDGLGGMLSTVKYYLGTVRAGLALPGASAQLFGRALHHLDNATGELRRVARDMMPEALQQFGLVPALQDVCDALSHGQRPRVQFQAYGLTERLPQRVEVVVYRLVQELLHNVRKHANAGQVIVQLVRTGPHIQLVVEDDGQGFEPGATHSGVGLHSIQARVDYLRGTLEILSGPGQGTTVTIEFSLPEA